MILYFEFQFFTLNFFTTVAKLTDNSYIYVENIFESGRKKQKRQLKKEKKKSSGREIIAHSLYFSSEPLPELVPASLLDFSFR